MFTFEVLCHMPHMRKTHTYRLVFMGHVSFEVNVKTD